MNNLISQIEDSKASKYSLIKIEKKINKSILKIFSNIKKKGKIMLCGNGGSAADAQHLAAEFLIRLKPKLNRQPIPAITLAQDTSTITACCNDYKFEIQYARCLEALGRINDTLIVISTSGNSKNILNVLKQAKKMKIFTIGFLGSKGGKAKKLCNIPLIVESDNTARIQESHIFLGHYILGEVEKNLIKSKIIKKI